MQTLLNGIFPVLQTPFDDQDRIDNAGLEREVAFCIAAGAHGLVYPALGSEVQYLADRERQQAVEVVLRAAAGRVPVVVAVSAPSAAIAVAHAEHAVRAGAQALMALPPYITPAGADELLNYYRRIAQAAPLPLIVQHAVPGVPPALLARLLGEIEHIRYIKEESTLSAHTMSALLASVGDRCDGIFGGAFGRWMLSELRRGAGGFMPAAEVVDAYVAVWNAWKSGDEQAARAVFNRLLPLINLLVLLGLRVSKGVLKQRGVFATTHMRMTGAPELDADDEHELEQILVDLQPFLTVKGDHDAHH